VARLDRDSARGAGLERILDGLRGRTIDLVVGTQMITKGHDFPGVTLVGVVLADHAMGLPDFRASERTFQLLEQVAGRAGRGERPGRVMIQTYNPNHPSVQRAIDHDYRRFFDEERAAREEVGYPPFVRLALVRIDGADGLLVRGAAEELAARARAVAGQAPPEAGIAFAGPSEAPLARLKGRARWQLLVKAATPRALRAVLRAALPAKLPRGVRVAADVDPVSMM
jgi:primosomal protein N' (replication factor Y)